VVTKTVAAKILAKKLQDRRLPSVDVPNTAEPELTRSLESIKEHLRMYEGDSNAPRERFVTMQELQDSGLITADVKNKFAFIAQIQGKDVVQPAGSSSGSTRSTSSSSSSSGPFVLFDDKAPQLGNNLDMNSFTIAGIAEADLLSRAVDETISGAWTFDKVTATGVYAVSLASTVPFQEFIQTDAAADEKNWRWGAASGAFFFQSRTDADGGGTTWLTLNRTGATVDNATFGVPILATSYDGVLAANLVDKSSGEDISGAWNFTAAVIDLHGSWLRIWDTGLTDYAQFAHDGTDFNFTFVNTANVDFQGMTNVRILAGGVLKILDSTSADQIQMWHDGIDANFNFTNTTDWNITGITAIAAGTVDADFDAITATSYGGVAEADLFDLTASENAMTGNLLINSAIPLLKFFETGLAADEGRYDFRIQAGDFSWRTRTDADGAGVTIMAATRGVGTAISGVEFFTGLTANSLVLDTTPLAETSGGSGQSTYTAGDILYSDAADSLVKLAVGADDEVLTLASGVPTWAAAGGGGGMSLTRIAASSGAAGADLTWQNRPTVLNRTSTTLGTIMTTTGVGAGVWKFKYTLIYQSSSTSVGIQFGINHTGTVVDYAARWSHVTSGTTAVTAIGDNFTGTTGGALMEGMAGDTLNFRIGTASTGVQLANSNILVVVEGILVISATGSLQFKFAGETTAQVRIQPDMILELMKIE